MLAANLDYYTVPEPGGGPRRRLATEGTLGPKAPATTLRSSQTKGQETTRQRLEATGRQKDEMPREPMFESILSCGGNTDRDLLGPRGLGPALTECCRWAALISTTSAPQRHARNRECPTFGCPDCLGVPAAGSWYLSPRAWCGGLLHASMSIAFPTPFDPRPRGRGHAFEIRVPTRRVRCLSGSSLSEEKTLLPPTKAAQKALDLLPHRRSPRLGHAAVPGRSSWGVGTYSAAADGLLPSPRL